jgi:hypothetical protein
MGVCDVSSVYACAAPTQAASASTSASTRSGDHPARLSGLGAHRPARQSPGRMPAPVADQLDPGGPGDLRGQSDQRHADLVQQCLGELTRRANAVGREEL